VLKAGFLVRNPYFDEEKRAAEVWYIVRNFPAPSLKYCDIRMIAAIAH